jgi:hypothetical protein
VELTTELLDEHYYRATKEEKMERRKDYLVDM